ncbi:MAG: GLUG motif-containing protein, partial [Gallionella sp.]|nr:GLUG motif-containing protein [Gallionella sp.]
SFSFSWDSTTIADGTYNLYVIATDNANNVGKLGPVAMTINNSSLGSPSQPAPITTCQEFQNIINHGGWYYEIKNDIDCAETKNWNGGKGFLSIGFGGVLNGYNYNISDLYMNTDYIGIFGQIDSGGRISGVNFRKVQLIGHTTYGGGFSAYNSGTIEKSSITGSMQLSNGNQCGGFAIQNSGTISQSWGDMTIGTSGYLGGIAGHGVGGKIENCYFKGELQSLGYAGGLVGINEGQFSSSGIINNSYSTAKVSGGSSNGGMIGWQAAGYAVESGVPAPTRIAYAPKPRAGSVPMAEFTTLAKRTPLDVLILDVRNADEASSGMIKGALLIPDEELASRMAEVPKGKRIVTHCLTGIRAEMAYHKLKEAGYNAAFLNNEIDIAKDGNFKIMPR